MKQWHGIVYEPNNKAYASQTIQQDTNSDQPSSTDPTSTANEGKSVNFVDLLEYCVPGRIFLISTDITVREEVNETLLKIAGGVAQLYKRSRGRARIDLDARVRKFHLFEGEIKQIPEFHEEIKSIQYELKEWKEKCVNLEEEKEKIYKEMAKALEEKEKVIQHLRQSNKQLEEYAENLSKVVGVTSYQGKLVSEAKNKTRTLKTFLPRSYLVKQCRQDLNRMCHLEGLKVQFPGAKVSSVENLLADHVSDYINKNPGFCAETDSMQIKISGDGAKMTNNANFILFSFAILRTGESVMSAKGNRTIGIVNGKKDYSTIKESFGDIINEMNRLVATGKINVEGTNINIEFFLGGDYKFILMMLGLNYACAWCKLHKDERWILHDHGKILARHLSWQDLRKILPRFSNLVLRAQILARFFKILAKILPRLFAVFPCLILPRSCHNLA